MTPVVSLDRDQPLLPAPDEVELPSPRAVYRRLIQQGWTSDQAGNLVAFLAGIELGDGDEMPERAWNVREVEQLAFIRRLVADGRLAGDTEAAS